jgi:hypothetical protein
MASGPRFAGFASSATLHILALLLLVRVMTAPRNAVTPHQPVHSMSTFIVGPTEDSQYAGIKPTEAAREDWTLPPDAGASEISLGDFRINVAKIADHAQVLFPFVMPGIALDHFGVTPQRTLAESLANPFAPPAANAAAGDRHRPLVLNDSALQALVDKSWSRRDRWTVFQPIARLIEQSGADAGTLPKLLQLYREENWPQPYSDRNIRDPRLWVELELAADHVNFIGLISRYASAHPSTRATTELLLLLDDLAQASQDAFATLMKTDPNEQLDWTRSKNRAAFELVVRLRRYYSSVLERKGLQDVKDLVGHFDTVRLGILSGIVRTTPDGYRLNDARFLIGAIYWRQGKLREALDWWRPMTLDPTYRYADAHRDILRAVSAVDAGASDEQIERTVGDRVHRALDAERGRWLMFSFDRLRQFGYQFDTF